MYIEKIELKNYRNYEKLSLNFNKNVNLILGENAQGKTNLLEAIYLSSMGRSFRTKKDSELIRFGCEYAQVKIFAKKEFLDTSVDIFLGGKAKKVIRKDSVNIKKISELMKNIVIVIFSPEDLKLVKDEPEKRRKFIDRELCQISPKYYDSLSRYKKTLAQVNAYLKEDRPDMSMLDLWYMQLAQYSADVMILRNKFLERMNTYSGLIHRSISGGRENLKIEYNSNITLEKNVSDQRTRCYEEMKDACESDLKNRNLTKGPHKDDMTFNVNDINLKKFGSQGQQRTCALSLKLAELNLIKEEVGEDAVLLLDDVMSELDAGRQEYLIDTLKENQLFITTTEIDSDIKEKFENLSVFYVTDGEVKEAEKSAQIKQEEN